MKRFLTGLAGPLLVLATPAVAQEVQAGAPTPVTTDALPILLSETELAETRGGQTVIINNQTLKAITSGNVIGGDYVAGDVSFNDDAFANFAGVGNFTINTGAQNNLQTAMILTVNVSD